MQPEFRDAVTQAVACCQERLGSRLTGAFLGGSVACDEAWPGESDVDFFVFADPAPREEDRAWARGLAQELTARHPAVAAFHLNLHPLEALRKQSIWRFILRYNAMRLAGRDVLEELRQEGIETPQPDVKLAAGRVKWLTGLIEATAGGTFETYVFKLPADPCLATRKLARWLILVEGAHVLMADGAFVSFRQADVLAPLERLYPAHRPLFDCTRRVLENPVLAQVRPEAFTPPALAFLRAGLDRIRVSLTCAAR
jgi:predicted nucleotidyltransferase